MTDRPADETVLIAPRELGLDTRHAFRRAAAQLIDGAPAGAGRLVIDLGGTRTVDSAGLGVLVLIQRYAARRRQQVVLRRVRPELRSLLTLTKLERLFGFEGSGAT